MHRLSQDAFGASLREVGPSSQGADSAMLSPPDLAHLKNKDKERAELEYIEGNFYRVFSSSVGHSESDRAEPATSQGT